MRSRDRSIALVLTARGGERGERKKRKRKRKGKRERKEKERQADATLMRRFVYIL